MSDEDPVRLKDRGSASPELVRALRALGNSSDAARLERVAQKLGATLAEGQPPMAASSTGLFGVKALVVGLVAAGIAALAWYGSSVRPPTSERRTPPVETQAPPQTPTAAVVTPSAPAALPETPAAPSPTAPAKPTSRHASSRTRASAPASTPASAEAASTAHASTPSANASPEAPAPAPAPRDEATHEPAPPQPTAAEPAAPPPSEAALLFKARKAVASQPSAALRLLDQHAALYPDGLLAPEREVLRIETLRRLGRTAEADQRLRAFQTRYPDSIHLRRLQQSEGGER